MNAAAAAEWGKQTEEEERAREGSVNTRTDTHTEEEEEGGEAKKKQTPTTPIQSVNPFTILHHHHYYYSNQPTHLQKVENVITQQLRRKRGNLRSPLEVLK
jgi:hypothetical protein